MWRRKEVGVLKGTVTDADGKPIRGALVETFLGLGQPHPATRVSYANGAFEFESLLTGNHFVRVTSKGFMPGTQDVNIVSGETTVLRVQLHKGVCEIEGRVTDEEMKPLVAEALVLKGGILIQKASTAKTTGSFHFRHLTAGIYEVQATAPCHASRAWSGSVNGRTAVGLRLPVVEGCVTNGTCDVCGETKEVKYCKFCHAFICNDCRHDYPERVKAMIRRRFRRGHGPGDMTVEAAFQKELETPGAPCAGCP